MFVSIITLTYNHEKYISKCIESVINQKYSAWELIIVDDGSTDNTGAIVKEYARKFQQIKYHIQENKGLNKLSETYNFALKQSKGDLIAILEGDDFWYEDKLEKQVAVFESNIEVVFSWCRVDIVQENETKYNSYPIHHNESKLKDYNNHLPASILNISLEDFPVPVGWMMRKDILLSLGGFLQTQGMPTVDMDTMYALSLKGKFYYFNEALCAYRRSVQQATRKLTIEITNGTCEITKAFYLNLSAENKQNVRFTFDELERTCKKQLSIAYSKYGRSCLVRKEFIEARKSYLTSISTGGLNAPIWALRSMIGLLFSYFKSDFEFLTKLLKKKSYK